MSQGTPSGRWWVEEGRTILSSQDPSPIPGTNPPGRGRGLMVLGVFLVEVAAGLWDFWGSAGVEVLLWVLLPPAVTCTQFSCHSAVTVHPLATEQRHYAGTLQKGGGSVSVKRKTGLSDQNSENQCFLWVRSNIEGSKSSVNIYLALRGKQNLIHCIP